MARLAHPVAGALIGLTLAGCAVGPSFVAPKTPPSASAPFAAANPAAASAEAPPEQWWRLYNDPVLNDLVGQALTENKDLKVAAANLLYAQALVSEARAGLLPTTELTAGATYGRSSGAVLLAALTKTKATPTWTDSAGFNTAYQVDLFGRIRRGLEAAHANTDAAKAAEDAVRVTVAAETTAAYLNVCGYAAQADIARQSTAVIEESYQIVVNERSAGAATDLDIDRQAALRDQTAGLVPTLEGQRRAALFELAALIGKTPAEIPAAAIACRTPPTMAQILPVGDGASLLRRRPDVSEAERQLHAATARIGVAAADLYPTISLAGSVSGAGANAAGITSSSGLSFGVGPLISWSFPNILVARAHVKEAGAQASAALASFDSVVLQALKEAEQALTTYAGAIEHQRRLASAQGHAADALRLAKAQYQAGAISGLDLITAETTAISGDQALAVANQQLAIDQVAVFQALGGGWEQAPAVKAEKISGR